MEQSYIWAEQIGGVQARFDAMNLVKLTFDAGCDVVTNPINFYVNELGHQFDLFWLCAGRIFGEAALLFSGENQYHEPLNIMRIPLNELKVLRTMISTEVSSEFLSDLEKKLTHTDDYYCEFEMTGKFEGSFMVITLSGAYGLFSPVLAKLLEIRHAIRMEIRTRKQVILNRLRNLVMSKLIFDRLGITVDFSLNEPFSTVFDRIMSHMDSHYRWSPGVSYEEMNRLLQLVTAETGGQGEIQIINGEGAAA